MDMSGVIIGAVGLVMAGLAVYFVTKSASHGDIEVNSAIGIRTKLTKSSQQAWEVSHRAALPFTLVACLLSLATGAISVTAAILANTNGASEVAPAVVLAAGYAGLLVVMFLAMNAGNRAVRMLAANAQ